MKIVLINASSRKEGNSMQISKYLASKVESEIIFLDDYDIGYFNYQNSNAHDDFIPLINKLLAHDVWILVTPVYWYSMSAQMKTFLDRFSDLLKWEKDLAIAIQSSLWYVVSCGSDETMIPGYFTPFRLSAAYLGIKYLGDIHVWKDNRSPLPMEVQKALDTAVQSIILNA